MSLHVHLEPVGGIAGDMFVAAMLDAFPELERTCYKDLQRSGVLDHVAVGLRPGHSHGLAVQRFGVSDLHKQPHPTGNYQVLRDGLLGSDLEEAVKRRALALLRLLAEAESYVHGVPIEQVHFHELADWDSLADIVAAASVIERSSVRSWSCAALPLGSGQVQTEHGMLPVPAPATARLLDGMPVWDDGEAGERVTPTGAAIVRYVLSEQATLDRPSPATLQYRPAGVLKAQGCGAGQRTLVTRPNILRCLVIEQATEHELAKDGAVQIDQVIELCFDIDDMTPEELAVALEHLRCGEGVLDASYQTGIGKKGRALFMVRLLCTPEHQSAVADQCFEETTTLGLRLSSTMRRILPRHLHIEHDELGTAGVKLTTRPSGMTTTKVESDDLAAQPSLQARRLRAQRLQRASES